MTLFFADLVRVTSHATGIGDLALGEALPGHRGFDAVPAGARFFYAVLGVTHPDQWETGEGEMGSGGTLVRLPLASSADGGIVDFSPGLKTVALTVAAAWFAAREAEAGPIDIEDVVGLQVLLDGKAALAGADFSGPVSAPTLSLAAALAIAQGGTGAASAAAARTNFGLGSIATQNAAAVAISGGTIGGVSSLSVAGDADVAGFYRADGVKVVGNRVTGWAVPGGTASRASFETGTVTVFQLAQRVKALIQDLTDHGLIGSS